MSAGMKDDVWLGRIRSQNRRHMGLEPGPVSQAVLTAHTSRPHGFAGLGAPPVAANPCGPAWGSGLVAGIGITCLAASVLMKHSPKTKKQLAVAGAIFLAVAIVKGRAA